MKRKKFSKSGNFIYGCLFTVSATQTVMTNTNTGKHENIWRKMIHPAKIGMEMGNHEV